MKDWFFPEKLIETEQKYFSGEENINPNNDFGSYKLVNQNDSIDFKDSMIECHNDINPLPKIKIIKRFIFKK